MLVTGIRTTYLRMRPPGLLVISGFIDIYPALSQLWRKSRRLLQLRVLRFGFLQDGDVGVGVFP